MKRLLLLAFICLGLAVGSQGQTPGELKIQSGQKLAFLGDSITQYGWERPGGYVRLVVAGLESVGVKVVPIPAGVGGNTSREMLNRLDRDVISKKPDWMTLSCGVNDVKHGVGGVELEPYKTNITNIVDRALAAGIKVAILTATVIDETDNANNQKLAGYNAFLRQLAQEKNLLLVDSNAAFWTALKANPQPVGTNLLTVDGVHMNPEGNMLMARGILEGFGVPLAQLHQFEETWRNAPDAVPLFAYLRFDLAVGTSFRNSNALNAIAKERKISVAALQNDLCFAALRSVMKAHEQDATLTPVQAQAEVQKEFVQRVEALVSAGK